MFFHLVRLFYHHILSFYLHIITSLPTSILVPNSFLILDRPSSYYSGGGYLIYQDFFGPGLTGVIWSLGYLQMVSQAPFSFYPFHFFRGISLVSPFQVHGQPDLGAFIIFGVKGRYFWLFPRVSNVDPWGIQWGHLWGGSQSFRRATLLCLHPGMFPILERTNLW